MRWSFRSRYDNLFLAGMLAVILTAFWVRPLNNPWCPFIAGDGLGYYAYLPAKFIHNDPNLDFKWFNRVYNENYVYNSFDIPDENILVGYKGKKINKYYQGLSFIWFPFFAGGHLLAKIGGYAPDGFSMPYQFAMGLASLCYLLLGLWFLRKLLHGVFRNQLLAAVIPFFIFFGTPLFTYAIHANTLSHSYSFTFITGFLFYLNRFFNEPRQKTLSFSLMALMLVIGVCIRPLNALAVLLIPAFLPAGFFRAWPVFDKFRLIHLPVWLLTLGALCWQLWLNHIQTGSLFAYTYSGETFNFSESRFAGALWGYQMGLLFYVPLIFFSFCGVFFMQKRMAVFLLGFFLGILFLYSSWWYWTIVKRALVDYYAIPAILLAAPLNRIRKKRGRILFCIGLAFFSLFFQYKQMQISRGILSEFTTHKELYWSNFLRLKQGYFFPVPPESIIDSETRTEEFESTSGPSISTEISCAGKASLLLDEKQYIYSLPITGYPAVFKRDGWKKIRLSMAVFPAGDSETIHAFLRFVGPDGEKVEEIPFYIDGTKLVSGQCQTVEFGYDLVNTTKIDEHTVRGMQVIVWNVKPDTKVFIDNVKLEFLLTDTKFETIKQ